MGELVVGQTDVSEWKLFCLLAWVFHWVFVCTFERQNIDENSLDVYSAWRFIKTKNPNFSVKEVPDKI